MEEPYGALHRLEVGRSILAVCAGALVLMERDAGPISEQANSIDEGQALGLLHEGDGVAGHLAAEALVITSGRADVERW